MAQRYDARVPKVLKVKIKGKDRYGNRFTQTASTVNVSRTGARLEGVPLVNDEETIEVSLGWFRKARFRVVWAGQPGTKEASQVGIRCVESDTTGFWGIRFPPPQPNNYQPAKAAAPAAATVPESGPIPVHWDSYDADRGVRLADPSIKEPVVNAADAIPRAWRTESQNVAAADRRVPITLRWKAQGKDLEENLVMARVLKDGSCMVSLKNSVVEGTEINVTHGYSGEKRTGRVSWCGPRTGDGVCPAAIELTQADPEFWNAAPQFGN